MPKSQPIAVVVLAAGKGTRMRSDFPKVLHKAAGRTLLSHVLHSAAAAKPQRTVVIAGPDMPEVGAEARQVVPDAVIAIQEKRQGTAHAVGIAEQGLKGFEGTMVFVSHDRMFLRGLGSRVLELGGESGTDRHPTVYPGSYVEYVQKLGHEAPGIYS